MVNPHDDTGEQQAIPGLPNVPTLEPRPESVGARPLQEGELQQRQRPVVEEEIHPAWMPDNLPAAAPQEPEPAETPGPVRAAGPPPIEDLLDYVVSVGGSDLILSVGTPPRARIDSELYAVGEVPLTAQETRAYGERLLNEHHRTVLIEHGAVDFGFDWHGQARFRGNAYVQRGTTAIALRHLPGTVPSPDSLGMPKALIELASAGSGLVLVTGPTGSGKSTTIASLLALINRNRAGHIITIEDPIEFRLDHEMSVVDQREVGVDTPSFGEALRSVLREDPDVVMVGEMRDPESIASTVTIAETGHLVFATLHANDAPQTIDRIIDTFPGEQQGQIRSQLASSLLAVVHQRLYPRIGGGRVAAFEVLLMNAAVRNLIREQKTNQIRNVMAQHVNDGMQTIDQSLAGLVEAGVVDPAHDPRR